MTLQRDVKRVLVVIWPDSRGYVTSSKYDVSDKGETIKCIFLILLQEKIPKNKAVSHITYS